MTKFCPTILKFLALGPDFVYGAGSGPFSIATWAIHIKTLIADSVDGDGTSLGTSLLVPRKSGTTQRPGPSSNAIKRGPSSKAIKLDELNAGVRRSTRQKMTPKEAEEIEDANDNDGPKRLKPQDDTKSE